jgi:hypothetical protein
MSNMSVVRKLDALVAVIPIRAVQALVADAANVLIAAVADSIVANITTRCERQSGSSGDNSVLGRRCKAVGRMMAMLVVRMTLDAQIEVLAGVAVHKVPVWKHNNTAVAGARGRAGQNDLASLESGRRSCVDNYSIASLCRRRCGDRSRDRLANTLCRAREDLTIPDGSLDKPVILSRADLAFVNTFLAKVIIAVVTNAAVEVCVRHNRVAFVTVYRPGSETRHRRFAANRERGCICI